MSETKALI